MTAPVLVGSSMAAVSPAASPAAVVLGAIAQDAESVWPVAILSALNGFAVVAALRAAGMPERSRPGPSGMPAVPALSVSRA